MIKNHWHRRQSDHYCLGSSTEIRPESIYKRYSWARYVHTRQAFSPNWIEVNLKRKRLDLTMISYIDHDGNRLEYRGDKTLLGILGAADGSCLSASRGA